MKKITALTIQTIGLSIRCIRTSDALVTEPDHILEFLNNCNKDMFNAVKDHAVNLRTQSDIKPLDVTCGECSHQYTQELSLDLSNFFETNS
jgi:plastocyanin domain-containing protein